MRYYRLSYPAVDKRRFGRRQLATLVGLEPMTFGVTGRRSNQLSYRANAHKKRGNR